MSPPAFHTTSSGHRHCFKGPAATLLSVATFAIALACAGDSDGTPTELAADPPGAAFDELGTWFRVAPLRVPVNAAAAAAYRGQIYVTGGYPDSLNSPPPTAAVQRYDPAADQWTRLNDLPKPVGRHTMAVFHDELLLIGGNITRDERTEFGTGYLPSGEILVYDLTSDTWNVWAHLPEPRVGAEALVAGDQLAVVAGVSAQQRAPLGDSVVIFTDRETWRHVPPPPDGLPGFPLTAATRDRAFVVTSSVRGPLFELDLPVGAWSAVGAENLNLDNLDEGFGVAGRFHAIGRHKHRAWTLDTQSWASLPPAPEHRLGVALAAIGDSLFVVGGGDERSNRSVATVDVYVPPR